MRIGLASIAGGLLGLERESHGRAAGLRTNMLTCVASAMAMILSQEFFLENNIPNWRPDPARLAAGVLAGMGFIGGGAIIRQGNAVRGVTTAAVLWFVTILGLVFGSGHIVLGVIGFGIALLCLELLPLLDNYIPNDWYGSILISVAMDGVADEEIYQSILESGINIKRTDLNYDMVQNTRTLHCYIKFKKHDLEKNSQEIVNRLVHCQGVLQVKWVG